jgi:hypothetical protein
MLEASARGSPDRAVIGRRAMRRRGAIAAAERGRTI